MVDLQPPSAKPLDRVLLRNLHTTACVGLDAWGRKGKQQPVVLSLSLGLDTEAAAQGDDVAETVSYGDMCRDVIAGIQGQDFTGVRGDFDDMSCLVGRILTMACRWKGGKRLETKVVLPKALLRVDGGAEYIMGFLREGEEWKLDREGWRWRVEGLRGACVVGVNDHERREKQGVLVSFGTMVLTGESQSQPQADPREIVRSVCEVSFAFMSSLLGFAGMRLLYLGP